jgi:long-chain fatty acid transport protein
MNRRNTLRLLAIMIAGVLALKASANGFRLADQDAFATARGEAFVATADNPSAIYYNPAGITQLEGNLQTVATLTTVPKTSRRFPSFFTPTLSRIRR